MLTAIVSVHVLQDASRATLMDTFRHSVPQHFARPGLIFKAYLYDSATRELGAAFVFEDRTAMVSLFDDAWRQSMEVQFGCEPRIRVFETPIVIDNLAGRFVEAASLDLPREPGVTGSPSATKTL